MALNIVIDARRVRDFGIGTYIRSLVHALSRIDRENCYTVVAGPTEARVWSTLPDNFRTALYAGDDHAYSDHVLFPLFLRRLKPDLVHIPLNRVPLLMIRPYVVTIHDMVNLYYDERKLSALHMHLRRFRFRRGLTRASRVIAVSEATKRDVANLLGVPPGRITRVYNAPDPAFLGRDPAEGEEERRRIMERYQIDRPFLLYAGAIRHHKNIPRLVEAFAVLREQLAAHPVYGDLRLVIIGDTISEYPAVRQAVLKSKMEHAVRFLGFVPFDTLRCFYEAAAAFVFPSRHEGFGLPPLEAMACGTPVVTSNVSSLPEVAGDAAMLVNPGNVFDIARGIRDVLTDEPLRAELIRRGRAQAARFSWERSAREVLEIYQDVAKGK
ncbi:MAG: glycosyltransferase family 1 protein [Bryobacteraceae bacterium]|jgi:glycosyltransferase involved in cell wall biosynthesis